MARFAPGRPRAELGAASWLKDVLDTEIEYIGDLECKRKARIVFFRFDGVYGLAGDLEACRQFDLRPVQFGAEHLELILHLS